MLKEIYNLLVYIISFSWLDDGTKYLLELVGFNLNSRLGESVHFFIYDVIKIFILLFIMIYVISFIRSYFSPERSKVLLEKITGIKGNVMGALLGIITPFCSCSSVPIFVGMVSGGVPLGITFSFLITSPMVNEAAFIILFTTFGSKIALTYVLLGVIVGVIGGFIIDKLKLEKYVEDFVYQIKNENTYVPTMEFKDRFVWSKNETFEIIKRVYKWIFIGVGLGAFLHGWTPDDFLINIAGPNNPFAVIVATIIAVPLYSSVMGMIPVASVLIEKGMAVGTAMSFMMATAALSLPEMMILRQVIKTKLIYIFVLITTIGIILVGYIFNFITY